MNRPRLATLFSYDWDAAGFARQGSRLAFDCAGFDLFSFPSNARIVGFDLDRFADRLAKRGKRRAWVGVVSHHEQYGALAAALVAERLKLPGTSPESIIAAQHKLHARRVLDRVAPEANLRYEELDAVYGGPIPDGPQYPAFVKPVKAAFSVLATHVRNRRELHHHTRFGRRELWVIRRLVEPFDRVARARVPGIGTAHRLMLEEPVAHGTAQFNLDGWVHDGQVHALGIVDAIMYPGTHAFMRWEFPSRLPAPAQARALDVARRFLGAIGYTRGMFNMEFFVDEASGRLSVIEFNPRLASQFSDLYLRVLGVDPHHVSLALALGENPAAIPLIEPTAKVASSFVYRSFSAGETPPAATSAAARAFTRVFPDGLHFAFPKAGHGLERDFKWLGSHRYGIVHLGANDPAELRERCVRASALLGWPAPYADLLHAADPQRWGSAASTLFNPGG
jgi:hypothetical protein